MFNPKYLTQPMDTQILSYNQFDSKVLSEFKSFCKDLDKFLSEFKSQLESILDMKPLELDLPDLEILFSETQRDMDLIEGKLLTEIGNMYGTPNEKENSRE